VTAIFIHPEVLYLIQESLRIDVQLKALPDHSDYWRRIKQDQHYHLQELGQHVIWAYQERASTKQEGFSIIVCQLKKCGLPLGKRGYLVILRWGYTNVLRRLQELRPLSSKFAWF